MTFEATRVFNEIVDAYLDKYRHVINEGGTSCFHPSQAVVTTRGSVQIANVVPGDTVKTLNESTMKVEWRTVKKSIRFKNHKKTVKINLKNGKKIIATDDHKVYSEGGWQSIKHILSLMHERNLETNPKIQQPISGQ